MLIRPCRWPLTDILSRSCAWKKTVLRDWGRQSNFHKEGERCLSLRVLIIHSFLFLLTTNWSKMKKRCKNYVTINITLLLNYVNQIDSMLLWVCSLIDHKRLAHALQSSASKMFFPYFHVICDRLQDRRTATWSVYVSVWEKTLGFSGVSGQLQK